MQLISKHTKNFGAKWLVALCVLLSGPVQAQVTEATMTATGNGLSRTEAVQAALVSAAGQAFGIKLDAQTSTSSLALEANGTQGNENVYLSALNKVITQRVNAPNNSPILGYSIDNVSQNGPSWEATVTLRYAKFEQIGPPSDRRSMIVVTQEKKFRDLLINNIEQALVASRRFDVLNRDNQALFEQEKAFVTGSDAAAAEVARLGQASGADYLVVASFPSMGISNNQRETIRLTGEVLVQSSVSGSVSIEVIEFSSRKLKWSGTEKFSATYKDATAVGNQALGKLVSNASAKLVDQLVDAIYPIRVAKVMGKNMAVINRGSASVKKGQSFVVFLMGEEIKDPQSGESLGALEIEIGTAKVINTNPKYSVVKLDDGEFDAESDYLVRPVQ
ncbi:hypothetical protein [Orrella daihaiensis]|uniref:Curli production assembly/transport component CsgG n=1 Tax=Orrella daihaiensis TaxID=2782176 RepID=A0ABY4AIC3_9BURK|nr:hypothetical protein [Orrella daihaiensis]UOD50031.1 hypothetical protein DHf2319_11405 [Orrella daihaiensis]